MIRTQLLLWLVVLGWAGEAGADIKLTLKHGHATQRHCLRPRGRR